jgi:hypothetical protein
MNDGGYTYFTVAGATPSGFNGLVQNKLGDTIANGFLTATTFRYDLLSDPGANATGSVTMTSPFDSGTNATGYPCMDQAGRGKSHVLSGDGDGGSALSYIGDMQNVSEPIVCVNNTDHGVESDCYNPGSNDVIVASRDYFNYNSGCVGASCTAGTGRGASLPTGCTPTATPGPWFVLTTAGTWNNGSPTSGKFYQCTATNTWSARYGIVNTTGEPYTYPHPLQNTAIAGGNPFSRVRVR